MDNSNSSNNTTPPAPGSSTPPVPANPSAPQPSTPQPAAPQPTDAPATPPQPPASPSTPVTTPPATPPPASPPPPNQPAGTPPPAQPPAASSSGKNPLRLLFVFLITLIVAGGAFAYWWYSKNTEMNTQQAVLTQPTPTTEPKPLLVGSDPTYEPMEYLDKDGKTVGYDIDLANLIADQLKRKLVIKQTKFDDIFTNLESSQYDMVISSITITEDRKKKYDFSEPYLNAGEVFVMQKKTGTEAQTLVTKADLSGKKIGAQKGTQMAIEAKKVTSPKLVVEYESNDPAVADLISGKLDAVLTDLPNAKGIVSANPTLRIASDPITDEYFAVTFRKGDPLKAEVDKIILSLKQKGVLTDLRKKWLE